MIIKPITIAALFLILPILGCGSADDGTETNEETTVAGSGGGSGGSTTSSSSTEVSGSVTMAPVGQAAVSIYALNADGSRGQLLGSTVSNDAGEYSTSVSHSGPVEVVATGGTYTDEATGDLVERAAAQEIRTMMSALDGSHVGINALSTIAAERASANAAGGLAIALAAANQEIAEIFGLAGIDFVKTKPDDLTDSTEEIDENSDESKLGLVMAGVSQMALDNSLEPSELDALVSAIAEDFADGAFDGKGANGADLAVALAVTPAQAMTGLSTALANFANGPRNLAGFAADRISTPKALPVEPIAANPAR